MKAAQRIAEARWDSMPIGATTGTRHSEPVQKQQSIPSMKTRLSILLLLTGLLASCSSYEIKSAQNEEHPCYSTWQWYPQNS